MKYQTLITILASLALVQAYPREHGQDDPPSDGSSPTAAVSVPTAAPVTDPSETPPTDPPTPNATPTGTEASTPTGTDPPASTGTGAPGGGTPGQSGTCPSFTMNDATVAMLIQEEGSEPSIYNDQQGAPTVGIGHKCVQSGCSEVSYSIPLSNGDMNSLLQQDLATGGYLACGQNLQYGNSNQRSVLVDLCFNAGPNDPGILSLIDQINSSGGNGLNDIGTAVIPTIGVNGQDPGSIPGIPGRRSAELTIFTTSTDQMC